MQFDVPLLPILVEVRWRCLPPLRFSIRGLMIAVVLAALFFSLVNMLGRLNQAINYHADQMTMANRVRSISPSSGPTPLETWHMNKMLEYRVRYERVDLVTFVLFMACVSLGVLAAFGRVIHWLCPPSVIAPGDEPSHRPGERLVEEAG